MIYKGNNATKKNKGNKITQTPVYKIKSLHRQLAVVND